MNKLILFCLFLTFQIFAAVDGGLKILDNTYYSEKQFCLKGDSIFIEVADGDLDTNSNVRETLYVQISSPTEPAGDTVKLIEEWGGEGWVMRGSIAVDSSAAAISGDHKIQAVAGQLITVKYSESANLYDSPVLHEKNVLFAGAVVDGGTSGNVTWFKSSSPYFISSTYQVNNGDTLTIEPGTKIFSPVNSDRHYDGVKILVYGHVSAIGTQSDSIVFSTLGSQPTSDDWEGFYIYNGSINLKYGVIRNSEYGVRWEYGYAPYIRTNLVRHSSFYRNKTAIRQYVYNAPNSSFIIDSNEIELFANIDSSSFVGISVNQSSSVDDTLIVRDNKISIHNAPSSGSNYGMELYGRYSGGSYYRAVIERNNILADSAYAGKSTVGLYFSNFKDSDLRNNRVSGFNRGLQLCQNSGSVINGNIFTRNTRDCYIDCTPDIQIRNNAFASNLSGGYGLYNANWADIDAKNNYWGSAATSEMNGGGNPKNIGRIYDKMDDSYSGKVDYAGWLSDTAGTPSATGNEGFVEILENGQYTFRQHFITGENALVRVVDADLNTDSGSAQTVKIRFQTGVESTDTLVLTEISNDTNVFEVVALIEENGSPSLKDGKIQVLPGQTINFTYNDLNNAFGASVQKNVLVTVAKTFVASGNLTTGKTVWSAAGSPYWLGGNITINSNDTLEIQNGTRVMFRANKSQEWGQYGDTINVLGTLIANGLFGDSVYIGPNTSVACPREWFGIRVSQYGRVSLKYTKLINAHYAVSFDYNYAYDTIVNRITHSLIKSARTGVDYRNSQSPAIWLSIDSSKFESAPNDTGSVQLINAWYDWNTYGDSLVIKDNDLIIHNGTVPNSSFTGIQIYGRKLGVPFNPAYILRNRIAADTLVMSSYSRTGIGLDNFQASFVQNNRIANFNEGIRAQDDSGTVISGNIFTGNKRHIQVNYGTAPRIDHNAFANPPAGGSALWNNGSYDVDARNNYWGGTATAEMNGGGNPKNIAAIFDRFDDMSKGQVNYAGWLSDTNGTPAVTGVSGMLQVGTVAFPDRPWFLPGDTAIIRLYDPNLNLNSGAAEQIKVAVSSNQETVDSVVLTEQGIDTSCFYGTVIIQEGASGTANDGKLHALPGSQLKVRYKDLLNDFGQQVDVDRVGVLIKTYVAQYSTVSGNWSAAGSPYLLDGSITIPVGDTLTLGAGTKLIMRRKTTQYAWENGDTIAVYGHIRANGTSVDSVHFDFMSPEKGPDSWFGILARNGGTVNLRYSSICNSKTAIDMSVSYGDTTIDTFRLSNSSISNCKQTVKAFVGRPDKMVFVLDSNTVDMPMPDSMGQYAVHFEYGQGSDGDSIAITGNVFKIHNRTSSGSGGAIIISSRNNGGMNAKTAIIRNNRFSSDSLVNSHNMFVGLQLASTWNVKVDSNEILGFGRGIYMYNDSGIDIRANKFNGNFVHVTRSSSNYTSWVNYNDFGPFRPGGYSVYFYMESLRDLDARYNYWGSAVTSEMTSGGNPKNISAIFDYYDNPTNSKVIYTGWRSSPVGNQPPSFSSIAPLIALQGRPWVYNMVASDPNGDTVVFVPRGLPSGAVIVANELKWRPMIFGTFPVTVGAASGGDTVEQHFMLNVVRDSIKPGNPVVLNVVAISDSAFRLSWNPASLIGTDVDSIGIWATSTAYPDTAPYMGGVLYSHRFGKSDSMAMATNMWPKLGLYFSLFVKDSAGNWSTTASQAFARTFDLQPPDTVQGLTVISLGKDSVKLNWAPSSSTDVDSIAICLKQDSLFPSSPSDGRIGSVAAGVGQFKAYSLQEKKVARFSVFARDSSGNWSGRNTVSIMIPDATPPDNITGLYSIYAGMGKVALGWHTSLSADVDSIFIRYRTDSLFPSNAGEGTLLKAYASRDSVDTVGGLMENTPYWFSCFTRDTSGNLSVASASARSMLFVKTPAKNIASIVASAIDTSTIEVRIDYGSCIADSVLIRVDTVKYVRDVENLSTVVRYVYSKPNIMADTSKSFGGLKSGTLYYVSTYAKSLKFWSDSIADFKGDTAMTKTYVAVAPVFTVSYPDTITIFADTAFSLPTGAADANGDVVTFSLISSPPGMTVHSGTGILAWNPTTANVGDYKVTVRATDGALYDTLSFDLKVILSNRAPVFITSTDSIPSVIPEKVLWTKFIRYYDPDTAKGDKARIFVDSKPAGMTFDTATGIISWTPTAAQTQNGPHLVSMRAIDTKGLEDTLRFSISVEDINEKPKFNPFTANDTAYQEVLFQRIYGAIDPDLNDPLKYSLLNAPNGMSIDSVNGTIRFTPAEGQSGVFVVRALVVDRGGLQDTLVLTLAMINRNDPPQITTILTVETISEKLEKVWAINVTDPDYGDVLRWRIISSPPLMVLDSVSGRLTWTPQNVDVGTNTVSVKVMDKDGLSDTITFTVIVVNVNDKPVIAVKEGPIASFGTVKIKFTIDDPDRLNGLDSTLIVSAALMASDTSLPLRRKEFSLKGKDTLVEFYPVLDGNYTIALTVKDDSLAATNTNRNFISGAAGQSIVSTTFRGSAWQMVAIPTDSTPIPLVLADTNRRTVSWSPKRKGYFDVQEGFTALRRGVGFWLYSPDSVQVNAPKLLVDTAYTKPCTLRVDTGWNMIATPYAYAVKFPFSAPLSFWSVSKNDYDTGSVMDPWKGYFFYSFDGRPVILSGKPFNPDSSEKVALGKVAKLNKETGEWLISVKAMSGGMVDFMNSFGALEGVQTESNFMNMVQPPRSPNGGPLAAFVSSSAKILLDRSVVAPFKGTKEWLMYVEPSVGEKSLELNFEGVIDLPDGYKAYVDNSGECFEITDNSVVKLNLQKGHYLSVIVSDDPAFLSNRVTSFSLVQNTPNPFNPSTTISFALPRSYDANGKPGENMTNVNLSIYDLRGRLVKQLVSGNQKLGARYSIHWDGKDGRGKTLSSGIYIYRLEAGKWSGVKRMVMVK